LKNIIIKSIGGLLILKTVGSQLKKLDDGVLKLNDRLQELDVNDELDKVEYALLSKKLSALTEILKYVNSYKWVKHQAVIDKIKFIRSCGFDYDLIKSELGLTDDSLKSFMYRVNQALDSKIGTDTVKTILSDKDNWRDVVVQFRILSGTYELKSALLSECYDNLPEKKFSTYSLKECREEIEYLYMYSNLYRKIRQGELDSGKLAFLRFILESETEKFRKEQSDLMLMLQGIKISYEDYMNKLENSFDLFNV